jgi:hypothetical protein
VDSLAVVANSVALIAQCDPILWYRRLGHLNMQSIEAQHGHGIPMTPVLLGSVTSVSCDSYLLHKASNAPRNSSACPKPTRYLMNLSSYIRGPVNVPSPHGLRYCLLVIDNHTNTCGCGF